MACVGVPADFGNVVAPGARFAPQRIRSASRALPE
ncbi:MAG: agmatinase, partial [Gallionella sp.]|nr:agmatinase [Gallionella sp.]